MKTRRLPGMMSYSDVVSRVAGLQAMLQQVSVAPLASTSKSASSATGVAMPTPSCPVDFSALLASASTAGTTTAAAGSGSAGTRALAAAESHLGQAESPPGSNDEPAIAKYRPAVEGAY